MNYYYETKVEQSKSGKRTVYHVARSGKAWNHPEGDPYMMDYPKKRPCPACEADKK